MALRSEQGLHMDDLSDDKYCMYVCMYLGDQLVKELIHAGRHPRLALHEIEGELSQGHGVSSSIPAGMGKVPSLLCSLSFSFSFSLSLSLLPILFTYTRERR